MCKKAQLIEYIMQDIIDMFATDQNIEYDEAMNKFYNSEVFEKLQDEETGLYLESPEYVYDLFKDELNFGHIVQAEIQGIKTGLVSDQTKDQLCSRVHLGKLSYVMRL